MEALIGVIRSLLRTEGVKPVQVRVLLFPPVDARIGALKPLEKADWVKPVGVRVP